MRRINHSELESVHVVPKRGRGAEPFIETMPDGDVDPAMYERCRPKLVMIAVALTRRGKSGNFVQAHAILEQLERELDAERSGGARRITADSDLADLFGDNPKLLNTLERGGLLKIGDVLACDNDRLLGITNLGERSLPTIDDRLAEHGLARGPGAGIGPGCR